MMLFRRWWLLPVLFVVIAGSAAVNRVSEPGHRLAFVLAVAAGLVLFAIDRFPWVVVVNGLLVGGYFAFGGENGPVFFTVAVATFLVALVRDVRIWLPLVLLSGVLVWAGLVVRGVRTDDVGLGLWQTVAVGAGVAAAAAIATSTRARHDARMDRVRAAGLRVEVSGDPGEVSDPVAEVSYVVVQEALTNVLRHAAATSATVEWTRGVDRVVLA